MEYLDIAARGTIRTLLYSKQVARRKLTSIFSRVSQYETVTGTYFLPNDAPDDIILNTIKRGCVFEPKIVDAVIGHISEGSTVVDVGANVGQMSVLFSRAVGPSGKVFSVEANPFIFKLLEKNLRINNCDNATPAANAAYDKDGLDLSFSTPLFWRFGSYGSYGLNPKRKSGKKVRTITIDSLLDDRPVDFIKVDVQGSDLFAMQGAKVTIERNRMPILFEYEEQFQAEFGTCFNDYMNFIDEIGYKIDRVINNINYLIVPK